MLKGIKFTIVVAVLSLFCAFTSYSGNKPVNTAVKVSEKSSFKSYIISVYKKAELEKAGLSFEVFERAVTGYFNIKAIKTPILSVIDFTQKSTSKRLWVIDMIHYKLLFNTLVAHGKNSGEQYAEHFSNIPSSDMSSLGFYITGQTYIGKHGRSLILEGLDKGFNDKARQREVVMHSADYVSEDYIAKTGRIGRSWGCPALPPQLAQQIISTTANGSCLYIYYPDRNYESSSRYLDFENASTAFQSSKSL